MNAAVFHQAVADGDATRVKFLINIGQQAKVNQRNKQGYTSLQQSCKDGRYDVADVLLSHGANIAASDKKGRTALHLASAGGYADIVKLLIASCADINTRDNEGKLAIDVAKGAEIAALLTKASEERQAKNPEANKKVNPEDWSQNVTSLPAGSRNSLVSNSSSDSGVFTEDNSSIRSGDYSKFTRPNGYTSSRSSSVMGVLNESEENLNEIGRERSWTVDEMGNSIDPYEQTRQRSHTFESRSKVRTKYEQSQYELGNHDALHERNEYKIASHFDERITGQFKGTLSDGNRYEQNQHESHLAVQTSMKMPHNTNPQPKLRRSMSERLPARQRKRLNGRRDISEELAALNLSRAIAREPQYYENELRKNNLAITPEPHSPNEDQGYGGESFEILNDYDEFGRSSTRKYVGYDCRSLPRNPSRRVEFYPTHQEAVLSGVPPQNRSSSEIVRDSNGVDYYDDVEFYRRNQPRNLRGSRRNTVEICPISNTEDRYLTTNERIPVYLNNEEIQKFSQHGRPRSSMAPKNKTFVSRDYNGALLSDNVTLTRNDSACSDTAIESYHRRMMQKRTDYIEDYVDYNGYQKYYEVYSEDLPSYEKTLQRRNSDSRRPSLRQVSQV